MGGGIPIILVGDVGHELVRPEHLTQFLDEGDAAVTNVVLLISPAVTLPTTFDADTRILDSPVIELMARFLEADDADEPMEMWSPWPAMQYRAP